MNIRPFTSGMVGTNSYLIIDEDAGKCIMIDCPDGNGRALSFIRESSLELTHILLTHGHFDHTLGLPGTLKEFPSTEVWMSRRDEYLIADGSKGNIEVVRSNWPMIVPMFRKAFESMPTDLHFYDEVNNELLGFRVIETPGHTPGSVCLWNEKENTLFSGDTIFRYGCGRTDFPYGSSKDIYESLERVLTSVPGNTVIWPGHGDGTTAENERKYNGL